MIGIKRFLTEEEKSQLHAALSQLHAGFGEVCRLVRVVAERTADDPQAAVAVQTLDQLLGVLGPILDGEAVGTVEASGNVVTASALGVEMTAKLPQAVTDETWDTEIGPQD